MLVSSYPQFVIRPEPERERWRSGEPALSEAEGNLLFPF